MTPTSLRTGVVGMLLAAAISLPNTSASGQANVGTPLLGVWATADGNLKLEMYVARDGYSGRILYGNRLIEADGRTWKRDGQNPDASLRSRSTQGIDFVRGLKWNARDKRWDGGRLYDPSSGRSASARARLNGSVLELRAYMGSPMLGRTIAFHRTTR
jgi:uncharacterized protein (DUF2147 family)